MVGDLAGGAVGVGVDAAFGGAEVDFRERLGEQGVRTQPVLDVVQVAATVVGGVVGGRQVAGVPVGLRGVVVADRVTVRVDDVVQVPPPRLLAPRVREGGLVARLTGVVAEHRDRPGRLSLRLSIGPARQPVLTEVVLDAVGRGDLPVLSVVIAVVCGGIGELLDLVPSSFFIRQVPSPAGISSLALPFRLIVALSYPQHSSPGSLPYWSLGAPSSPHDL